MRTLLPVRINPIILRGIQIQEKKAPLGSGERFKKLEKELKAKGVENPGGLAAWIGRKKLGKKKFQKLSAKGR